MLTSSKNIIFFVAIFINFILLIACNEDGKQTKNETIFWLEEKLLTYYGYEQNKAIEILEINENRITLKIVDGKAVQSTLTFPVGVGWKKFNDDGKTGIETITGFSAVQTSSPNNVANNGFTNTSRVYIREDEPDLINRIIKALEHLSSFSKKNESF